MKRRTVLAGVPSALLLGGCTDLLTEEEVRFEAERAIVSEAALSDSEYEESGQKEDSIERDFDEVDRTVVVVNKMSEYARSVDIGLGLGGELARFTALSTPKIDIVPGRSENPIGDMNNDELAEMLQEEYDDIENIQRIDARQGTLLGEDVEITRYEAEAQTDGESIEVEMHIAQGENEDDFLVALGVHPQEIDDQEEIDRLIDGIEHPA